MLTWEPDKERALESTFHDSIPFLLFAPDEFRGELIMRLRGLYTSCNPRSTDNFIEELKRINEMLKDYDFGETVNIHIVHLQTILKPFNQTLAEHSIRLNELEKQVKNSSKYNKYSAKIKSKDEVTEKHKPRVTDVSPKMKESKNMEMQLALNAQDQETQLALNAPQNDNNIDLVYNYISQHLGIHTELDLAEELNLTKSQICMAFNNLLKRPHIHGEKIKHIKVGKTYYKPNPNLRSYSQKTYQWVENMLDELSDNNKIKIKWILPLYPHSEST